MHFCKDRHNFIHGEAREGWGGGHKRVKKKKQQNAHVFDYLKSVDLSSIFFLHLILCFAICSAKTYTTYIAQQSANKFEFLAIEQGL